MSETATQEQKKVRIEIPGVDGSGAQVFEGETETEVLGKLQQAQEHASKKIREQQQQLDDLQARYTPAPAAPEADGFDRNGYFNVLYEDPRKAFDQMFEQRFGMSVKDAATEWQSMREASDFINVNKVGHALIAKHPELRQVTPEDSNENAKMLDKIMAENKWEYTLGNLEAAYAVATTQGKMRLPAKPNTEADVPPHPPATLTGHSGGGEPADEKELLRTMSTDQVREYYINKHKNAQRST